MSISQSYFTQEYAVVDQISPASRTSASDVNGEQIDGSRYHSLIAHLLLGAIGASGTAQIVLQHTATSGSGWADVSGAITAATADTDDDGCVRMEVQLFRNPSLHRYLRFVYRQTGTNAILGSILVLGKARHLPSSQYNDSGDAGTVISTMVI